MITRPRGLRSISALSLVIALCACGGLNLHQSNRVETQREAGSVHVAVLSVAPWSHYARAMQPNFALSAEEALATIIQDSRFSASSETQAVGLGVGLQEQGELEGVQAPTSSITDITIEAPKNTISTVDPLLRYQAAISLYQEVQLLNRTIANAAIAEGSRPYLVRLQVTLLPLSRHEPYDAYATLSFFSSDTGGGDSEPVEASVDAGGAPLAFSLRNLDLSAAGSGQRGPSVLPLLVTDNLEATLQSRVASSTGEFSLDLLSYMGSFASNVSADLYERAVEANVLARDLNGLLTVARLSENSLRVRLGAMQEATSDYAMVPRNHNITLLLMVPESAGAGIDLIGRVNFVDAETGVELPGTSDEMLETLLAGAAQANGLDALTTEDLKTLTALAQVNDQPGFFGALGGATNGSLVGEAAAYSLWVDLVSLLAGGQYFSSHFDVPGHSDEFTVPVSFFEQTAIAVDNGSEQTLVELHGASLEAGAEVTALIVFFVEGQEVRLPAHSVAYEGAGGLLRLGFPSLSTLGFAEAAGAGLELFLNLPDQPGTLEALYVRPPEDG